jgi:hypothetical protein
VNIGQLVTTAIAALVGVFLAGQVVGWQHKRAARAAAAGRPVNVPASICTVPGGRFGVRWRHGTATIVGDRVVWTPRTPWGRSVPLSGFGYGTQHKPTGVHRWLLPSAAVVVSCLAGDRGHQLAVLPASVKYLFRAQFATV